MEVAKETVVIVMVAIVVVVRGDSEGTVEVSETVEASEIEAASEIAEAAVVSEIGVGVVDLAGVGDLAIVEAELVGSEGRVMTLAAVETVGTFAEQGLNGK